MEARLEGRCWGRGSYSAPWEQAWCSFEDGCYILRYEPKGDADAALEQYTESQMEAEVDGEYITFKGPSEDESMPQNKGKVKESTNGGG